MEANELRIGNKVFTFQNGEKVEHVISGYDLYMWQVSKTGWIKIEPIPLTEEWLLKFGFVQFPASNLWDKEDFWAFYKKANTDEWRCDPLEMQFKYVHQLQNLYYALTGTELIINL